MKNEVKIIAYLGESFIKIDNKYAATQTSAAFIQEVFDVDNVVVCGGLDTRKKSGFSSFVNVDNFQIFPHFISIKDFMIKSLFTKGWYKAFINRCDEVIDSNPDAVFWIRAPSIGSVVFGQRVLQKKRRLINHICADISNTWRDPKYGKFEKILGYLFSKYLLLKLKQLCMHKHTIANLCTGDKLQKISYSFAPKNTYQFVDLMSESKNLDFIPTDITPGKFKILFVGRIVEDKGVFDLLEAACKLDFIHVEYVGGGPDLDKLITFIHNAELTDRVLCHGQIPFNQLSAFYQDADVVVVPSNNNYEGFPRVIMEAWSYYKPVIVSNVGGINAFVKHGQNGLIFEPGNSQQLIKYIDSIYKDKNLYRQLQNGALESAKFSSKKYWIEIVQSLVCLNEK